MDENDLGDLEGVVEEPEKDNVEQVMDNLIEAFQDETLPEGEQSMEDIIYDANDNNMTGLDDIGPITE